MKLADFKTIVFFCPFQNYKFQNSRLLVVLKHNREAAIGNVIYTTDWQQMAIKNTVFSDSWSVFVDCKERFRLPLSGVWRRDLDFGENCIQNFHLGRYMYIIGFSHKFSFMMTYQRSHKTLFAAINPMKHTSSNENFEFSYPYSNALLHLLL